MQSSSFLDALLVLWKCGIAALCQVAEEFGYIVPAHEGISGVNGALALLIASFLSILCLLHTIQKTTTASKKEKKNPSHTDAGDVAPPNTVKTHTRQEKKK